MDYTYPDVCSIRLCKRHRVYRQRRRCRRYGPLAVHDALYIRVGTGERQYRYVVTHAASGRAVADDLAERAAHDLAARLARLRCWEGAPETIAERFTPRTRRRVFAAISRARRESEAA